ncbi:MAG: proteasome activator [Acidimicrobiia bacterium]
MSNEPVERGELILPEAGGEPGEPGEGAGEAGELVEAIEQPGKVLRIGSMIKQLLDEVRAAGLDETSRERLRQIFDMSVSELSEALSPDLRDELNRLAPPFSKDSVPSEAELRVAQAQLVGWLEGLFHGIQATLFAQQMTARQQLEQMQRGQLPRGGPMGPAGGPERPGTYL